MYIIFDIICCDSDQRKRLEKKHKLRMTQQEYTLYEHYGETRVTKCLDVVVPLTSSDQMYTWRLETQLKARTISRSRSIIIKSHVCNALEFESTASTVFNSHLKPPIFHHIYLLMLYYQIYLNRIEENGHIYPDVQTLSTIR